MLRIDFSRRGAFSLQGPSSSFPCPLTSSLLRLHGLSWTPGWRCGPQKERSKKPVAMMMSCTGVSEFSHLHAFIQPCNHPPVFPSGKKKKGVFYKTSPLAFSIPPFNANANANSNTLIKNTWEENTNLLFCNPPQGAHRCTQTNKNELWVLFEMHSAHSGDVYNRIAE